MLIGFGYDWRQSNVDSAQQLDDYLGTIASGSGRPTTTSFAYVPSGSTPVSQLVPQINTAAGGGDGTVPVWSTSLLAAQAFFDAGPVTLTGG